MNDYAIIVAGGSGSRMKSAVPKQFLLLGGKPLIEHTIDAFLTAIPLIKIILVVPEDYLEKVNDLTGIIKRTESFTLTSGGATRFESVKNGLRLVPDDSIVFVHDGVRCLVSAALIKSCRAAATETGNAIPAIAPADSIRLEHAGGNASVDRARVRLIQTPQTFKSTLLKQAYAQDYRESFTDDASVLEAMGEKIRLVEGDPTNIKITLPFDLVIAEQILKQRG